MSGRKGTCPGRLFVALWVDDYDGDLGAYQAFRSRKKCLDYLADTVLQRAAWFKVKPLDLENPVNASGRKTRYPALSRAGVRRQLERDGRFSLAISMNDDGTPLETVSVGMAEVDVT